MHKLDEIVKHLSVANSTNQNDDNLQHFGVKGMKWGVRRDATYKKGMKRRDVRQLKKMKSAKDRKNYLNDKDTKWLTKVKDDANIQKVTKAVTKDMRKINKQLKKQYGSDAKRMFNRRAQAEFQKEMKMAYEDMLTAHTYRVYKMSPSRTREVRIESKSGGLMKAVVVERDTPKLTKQRTAIAKAINKLEKQEAKKTIKHSDQTEDASILDGMFFLITVDDDGFPDDVIDPFEFDDSISQNDDNSLILGKQVLEDVIKHFGIKGMKWDKRKTEEDDAAKAEGFLNAKDKAEWERIVKEKNLSPKQAAELKAFTTAMRNAKPLPKSTTKSKPKSKAKTTITTTSTTTIKSPSAASIKSKAKAVADDYKKKTTAKPEPKKRKDGKLDGNAPVKATIPGVMKDGKKLRNIDVIMDRLKSKKKK